MIPPAAGFSLKRKERRREFKDSSQETAAERLDWRTYNNAEECKGYFEAEIVSFSQLSEEAELKVIEQELGRELIWRELRLYYLLSLG